MRERDADEDYNYETSAMRREFSEVRKKRKDSDNGFVYDNGELGLDFEHFDDGLGSLVSWTKHLPKINFNLDPVINFKLKQKISHFGACITLGKAEKNDSTTIFTGLVLLFKWAVI